MKSNLCNAELLEKSKQSAEIFQSQNAVSQLKKMGGIGKHRQQKYQQVLFRFPFMVSTIYHEAQVVNKPTLENNSKTGGGTVSSADDALLVVADYLQKLLWSVEDLYRLIEKKSNHDLGYSVAFRCIRLFSIFNQLKFATIHDILRQYRDESQDVRKRAFKILQDLTSAESYVLDQALRCLSLFALSTGDYVVAAECSRFVIKKQGPLCEPHIWLLRGLSFLGAGYGHQHPELVEVISYLDCIEIEEAKLLHVIPFEWFVEFQLVRSMKGCFNDDTYFLKENPNLSKINIVDCKRLVDSSVLCSFIRENDHVSGDTDIAVHPEYDFSTYLAAEVEKFRRERTSIKSQISSLGGRLMSVLQEHSMDESVYIVALSIAHRLFYEAQILYLESMFSSAEQKYTAMLVLLEILEGFPVAPSIVDHESKGLRDHLTVWKGVTLLNISGCRFHRGVMAPPTNDFLKPQGKKKSWDFTVGRSPIVNLLRRSSTLDLCESSSTYLPSISTTLRKVEIFRKLNRPFDLNSFKNNSVKTGNAVIGNYGPGQVFSQLYAAGFPMVVCYGLNETAVDGDHDEEDQVLRYIEDYIRDKHGNASTTTQILEMYRSQSYNMHDLFASPRTAFDPSNEEYILEEISRHLHQDLNHIMNNIESDEHQSGHYLK